MQLKTSCLKLKASSENKIKGQTTKWENIYNMYNKGLITTYQQENMGKWGKGQVTKEQRQ